MNLVQLRMLNRALVYAIAAIVPLVFWRSVTDSFDLTKGTVLNIFGTFLLGALVLTLVLGGAKVIARPVWIAVGAFAAGSLIATITSMAPTVSIVGQSQRYTGLATILSGLLVTLALVAFFNTRQLIVLVQVMVGTAVVVALYTLMQESNNDPFEWFSESFGKFVFSTLGNPNTGAAYTAVTLPVVAWAMLRKDHHVSIRITAGAVFGSALGSLAVFQSFQGPVAAVVTIAYLVAWALLNGRTTGSWLIAGFMSLAIPLMTTRTGGTGSILLLAVVFGALAYGVPTIQKLTLPESLYAKRKPIAGAVGALALVALVVVGPGAAGFIADEIEGGMNERGDFYRSAVEVFQQNPVVGSGLETFGFVFAENRPENHATRLEASRTSSVHSVPLGMFSNGGIILGLTYLGFVGFTGYSLVRALRRDITAGSGALLAAGTAWLAYQVQSLVSVEHVALFTLHFTLAGIVLAFAWPNGFEAVSTAVKRGRNRNPVYKTMPAVAVAGVGVVALVAVSFVITRPMQAARASFLGLGAAYQAQDGATAFKELTSATDRAPWEPVYHIQLAEILQGLGRIEDAAAEAIIAVERSFYNPGITPQLAQLVANAGDTDTAVEFVREAVRRDPLAPGVSAAAARLMTQVGATKNTAGDAAGAQALYDEALALVGGRAAAIVELGKAATEGGDDATAVTMVRTGLAVGDATDELKAAAAQVFVGVASRKVPIGDIDGARALYNEALGLVPALQSAVDGLAALDAPPVEPVVEPIIEAEG